MLPALYKKVSPTDEKQGFALMFNPSEIPLYPQTKTRRRL